MSVSIATKAVSSKPRRASRAAAPAGAPQADTAAQPPLAQAALPAGISPARRRELIEESAYFRALRRGFQPGLEWEDWLAAEREVDAKLGANGTGSAD